mmetsp:Transcript_10479/g.18986  ORF Transcript_10479/g.18986 Transcript_10479/m.18986 type:complete len:189 (-) Transcript_10479:92-658(-)
MSQTGEDASEDGSGVAAPPTANASVYKPTPSGFGKLDAVAEEDTKKCNTGPDAGADDNVAYRPSKHAFEEFCLLLPLSLGLCITWISFTMKETVDMAIIGHLGAVYAQAVALSYFWMSATYGLMMSNALSVFVSQAIGAKNPAMSGVYLQVKRCRSSSGTTGPIYYTRVTNAILNTSFLWVLDLPHFK